jgi:glycosyltransferase involved in cell wall biosynthesis
MRQRGRVSGIWPIMAGSERPPHDWPGWREGKQFALILTHDVEGPTGLAKCPRLMELELERGFHSSFNFIPEGGYSLSPDLREGLRDQGFEVGVHDLYHDGKLYQSYNEFLRRATRINEFLKAWGAVGFRSGFMLHNLEWLHELDIQYDASTFDTDPFEPQPDNRNTIFPFWVAPPAQPAAKARGNGAPAVDKSAERSDRGYIELPYTLPQDSTLFLLLGERHPDIWFQKLDWIARQGGMALVNVHPDYLHFEGDPPSPQTFPVEFYTQFLAYARKRYGDSFWNPLPQTLAAWASEFRPQRYAKPKRICMLTHSYYASDARVMRYAEVLAARGDEVEVLSLRRSREAPKHQTLSNVRVICIQPRVGKQEKSALDYLVPILRFFITASLWITRQHVRKPYELIHVHNVPDFLVFAAWYPRLRGAKLILDIHDIVPEFYRNKFGVGEDSATVKTLKWIERRCAKFAHQIIVANDLWQRKYASRTGSDGKCSAFVNNVDRRVFHPLPRTRNDGKVIVLFPGGLQWHQGVDIAIKAFPLVISQVPEAEFHIYGDGNMKRDWTTLKESLCLGDKVRFFHPLSVREIAQVMANADLGVVPKRADSFGDQAYSTKIMEFMALGVPVVVANTTIDRHYFNDSVVRFFKSGDHEDLAKAMVEVILNDVLRHQLVTNALKYADHNSWERRKDEYLSLVDSMVADV